jgi:DNA-binding XRE family transcriptional regulator
MDANGQDTVGRRLRLRRAELGLTLEQLADRTGLSVRGISDIERDRTKAPRGAARFACWPARWGSPSPRPAKSPVRTSQPPPA